MQEDLAEAHHLLWRALNSRTLDGKDAEIVQVLEVIECIRAQKCAFAPFFSDCPIAVL